MTGERLERLAASEYWTDRQNAAGDSECPPELLVKLTGDEDYDVRDAVATNPSVVY